MGEGVAELLVSSVTDEVFKDTSGLLIHRRAPVIFSPHFTNSEGKKPEDTDEVKKFTKKQKILLTTGREFGIICNVAFYVYGFWRYEANEN